MEEERYISVEEFAKKLDLEVVFSGNGNDIMLNTMNVSRPGLQLAGFFDYFGENRVQVMGNAEMKYYEQMSNNNKEKTIDMILSRGIPCSIIARDLPVDDIMLSAFKKHNVPLFRSSKQTTQIVNNIIIFLNDFLAPIAGIHGVLLDVLGIGVLILGNSGIGKSETALELIKRGHRLVADDSVLIKRVQNSLVGTSPKGIRNYMELRGIGIIDVRRMYGVGAVKEKKHVELVIKMEEWDNQKEYDRLYGNGSFEEILGIKVPMTIIPIKPGRNLPVIIETAAANFSLKKSGIDATQELINETIKK